MCAYDKDVVRDDFLGDATTDAEGRFAIDFTDAPLEDFLESRPDLYPCVVAPGASVPIRDTSHAIRGNASKAETCEVEIDAVAATAS